MNVAESTTAGKERCAERKRGARGAGREHRKVSSGAIDRQWDRATMGVRTEKRRVHYKGEREKNIIGILLLVCSSQTSLTGQVTLKDDSNNNRSYDRTTDFLLHPAELTWSVL